MASSVWTHCCTSSSSNSTGLRRSFKRAAMIKERNLELGRPRPGLTHVSSERIRLACCPSNTTTTLNQGHFEPRLVLFPRSRSLSLEPARTKNDYEKANDRPLPVAFAELRNTATA